MNSYCWRWTDRNPSSLFICVCHTTHRQPVRPTRRVSAWPTDVTTVVTSRRPSPRHRSSDVAFINTFTYLLTWSFVTFGTWWRWPWPWTVCMTSRCHVVSCVGVARWTADVEACGLRQHSRHCHPCTPYLDAWAGTHQRVVYSRLSLHCFQNIWFNKRTHPNIYTARL